MTTLMREKSYSNTVREKYTSMRTHFRNGNPNDGYTISYTNYNFLLNAYDEKEKLKAEVKMLKNELKHYKGDMS